MHSPATSPDSRLQDLDGFRVEISAERERADIILDRPPLNTISMPQRDQLRQVFDRCGLCETWRTARLRASRQHRSVLPGAARSIRFAGGRQWDARDLRTTRVRRGWWPDQLWCEPCRRLSTSWYLRRPSSQG